MSKSGWMKETAEAFGMTLQMFADFLGYSRSSVYQASVGNFQISPSRLEVTVRKLEGLNKSLLKKEQAAARENFNYRQNLIKNLEERLSR